MYEYITGTIAEVSPTHAVIETAGIGYFINISLQSFTQIEHAEQAKLYVHFIVREDVQILYGFATKEEREVFRLLISVSGVGGNTARMILSTFSPVELRSIITTDNAAMLKNVKGLGIKTAQKIIVELKDKMLSIGNNSDAALSELPQISNEVYTEALSALSMLGFAKSASDKVVRKIIKDNPSASVEEVIRLSLKSL